MIFQQFNLLSSRTVAGNIAYPLKVAGWDRAKREGPCRRAARVRRHRGQGQAVPQQAVGRPEAARRDRPRARDQPEHPAGRRGDERPRPRDHPGRPRPAEAVNRELGITVVVITHEMDVVKSICDRVAVMEQGKVVESGDVYQVFADPQHRATRRFVGATLKRPAERPRCSSGCGTGTRHSLVTVAVHEDGSSGGRSPTCCATTTCRAPSSSAASPRSSERPFGSLTWELVGDETAIEQCSPRCAATRT